jgi:gamma-glutamylcyclotransferase (GGCT)/AIG2-like uncharacterized protein YtfP
MMFESRILIGRISLLLGICFSTNLMTRSFPFKTSSLFRFLSAKSIPQVVHRTSARISMSAAASEALLTIPSADREDGASTSLTYHPIFCYGSLLSGLNNHHVMVEFGGKKVADCVSVDSFYLTGFRTNAYPYLSKVPLKEGQVKSRITGELYAVPSTSLAKLDAFEEHPVEYFRTPIEIEDCSNPGQVRKAYVYLLINDQLIADARATFDEKFWAVESGNWRKHLESTFFPDIIREHNR